MRPLQESIAEDAARSLELPAGRTPAQELARYKRYLKLQSHRIRMAHRAGLGGLAVCRARAALMDHLLASIFRAVQAQGAPASKRSPLRVTLVAIGGYGRGELNPHSDVDIMILHDGDTLQVARGQAHPMLAAMTDPGGLLYTLFDLGLKVGYSVRNLDDSVRVANTDMQSKTSLLEARWVSGDEGLFKRLQAVVLAQCVRGYEDDYIAARLLDQASRREKYGNSAFMQEPNIKNGCGGLRDSHNLQWMAFVKYRTRTLAELEDRNLIGASERKQLEQAHDALLRVRNELHYHLDRPAEVLLKSLQPTIAHHLGYTDRSPVRRLERFMRDVYLHMRNVFLITRTLEQRLALLPQPERRIPSLRHLFRRGRHRIRQQLVDGFKFVEGEIWPQTQRVFKDQPRRLMRVFLYAQQRGLQLNPDLAQLIRQHLPLVDRAFLRDPHVHETFLEILNQRGRVAAVLRSMHEVGFLGKYIPEFGRLTALVQHEFYHQYTADEHTLFCLEKLDQVWDSKEAAQTNYAALFRQVDRPFLLYLALLLHDAGKAFPTNPHADKSGQLASAVARRIHLDPATASSLRLLVQQHVTMAQVSQRRDLDDASVIQSFVKLIGTPDHLRMLTLLTYADATGTSDKLWNGFKDQLLWTLYHKSEQALTGGAELLRAEANQREQLLDSARGRLPASFSDEEIRAHFDSLPARYYRNIGAEELAEDLQTVHDFLRQQIEEGESSLEPVVLWRNLPDRGYTVMKICTWDRAGLFSKIAGSLTAARLNILSAQVFSRGDGVALDTFYVTDAKTGLIANREEKEECTRILSAVLNTGFDLASAIRRARRSQSSLVRAEWEGIPTVIRFDNELSEHRTILDLQTEDRLGLLYAVSTFFTEMGLDISLARVSTEQGAAIDTFYLQEASGERITDPVRLDEVERGVKRAIQNLDLTH